MHFISIVTGLALAKFSVAGYTLQDDYTVGNFFNMFDFFTSGDPTHGFVNYVDQSTAQNNGYISTSDTVYIGVDSSSTTSSGRNSVRLTSKNSYNEGLVILDLAHMPGSVCGTWPAFWMVGPNWPSEGEIDIIEGVNSNSVNQMTLHTGPGCTMNSNNANSYTGYDLTSNCDVNAAGQGANVGCGISTSDSSTYGDGFNNGGGGVYAMEWTTNGIGVWHFSRNNIPGDISGGNPDPSGWGLPVARFAGGDCNYGSMFANQQIVFDITFCGDWAGAVWGSDSTCSPKASSCTDFVGNNPSAFQDTYWSINSLRVYQESTNSKFVVNNATEASSAAPVASAVPASSSIETSSSVAPITTLQTSSKVAVTSPTSVSAAAAAAAATTTAAAAPAGEELQSSWFGPDSNGIPDKRDANASEEDIQLDRQNLRHNAFIKRHLSAHQRRFASKHGARVL